MVTQLSRWDNVGTEAPAGDAEYVAGQQPIAEWDNYFNWSAAKDVENLIAALENITTGHDHDGANSKAVDGSDVVNTPAGNIVATDVQAALNELDTEKAKVLKAVTSLSADTTLDSTHYTVGVDASGAVKVITLPAAASHTGRIYNISKRDASANTVTIDANAAELINGAATLVISVQYDSYTIQSDGTGWWII